MKQWLLTMLLLASPVFALRADINRDGRVDLADWAILAEEWLMTDTYGPELITNGVFDDGSVGAADNWTSENDAFPPTPQTGWYWSSGDNTMQIDLLGVAGPYLLYQTIDKLEPGYTYQVSYEIKTANTGTLTADLGGTAFTAAGTLGTHTMAVVAGSDDENLTFSFSDDGQTVEIDNISVKLVIPEGALVSNESVGTVTVKFAVPFGHEPGDYCMLYSNSGSGSIDWDTPFSTKQIPLFPGGAGNYGFAMGPFGLPSPKNLRRGFGTCPFAMTPFGFGAVVIARDKTAAAQPRGELLIANYPLSCK